MPVAFSLRPTPRRHLYIYPNILFKHIYFSWMLRDARGEIRCGNRIRDQCGGEPWYKFIFVPNFHALTATPIPAFSNSLSDVTLALSRRFFFALFHLLAIRLLQPFLPPIYPRKPSCSDNRPKTLFRV